jgi:hypothetical protein
MKQLVGAAALAAFLFLAQPTQARADGCGFGFKITLGGFVNVTPLCGGGCGGCGPGGGGGGQAGPWYQYWPLEAHFQTPALPAYPYWPQPMGLAPGVSFGGPAQFHQENVQPAGYSQQTPYYWYGR